jgi:hypothetical protein
MKNKKVTDEEKFILDSYENEEWESVAGCRPEEKGVSENGERFTKKRQKSLLSAFRNPIF